MAMQLLNGIATTIVMLVWAGFAFMALFLVVAVFIGMPVGACLMTANRVRLRLGPDLTPQERADWGNGLGRFAMARTLEEARSWKQIEQREPWNLPAGLGEQWRSRTGWYHNA
jgi:hypothetical protein